MEKIVSAGSGGSSSSSPQPGAAHTGTAPSAWIQRFSGLVPEAGTVLDVACGSGRHMRWFSGRGHPVIGVDRSQEALDACEGAGQVVLADIENGPWPFDNQQFACVVVTNYLWRPLLPTLVQSVAPGGVLLYETFAAGNETVGKPSNPDFLLQPGELLAACKGLRVVGYEDGFITEPPRFVQRLAAVGEVAAPNAGPTRFPL